MDDEPLNFEEHRRRRKEHVLTVPCVRCKKWIVATATRCPECGVHFEGEAQDFADDDGTPGRPAWLVGVAVLLLVLTLLGILLGG